MACSPGSSLSIPRTASRGADGRETSSWTASRCPAGRGGRSDFGTSSSIERVRAVVGIRLRCPNVRRASSRGSCAWRGSARHLIYDFVRYRLLDGQRYCRYAFGAVDDFEGDGRVTSISRTRLFGRGDELLECRPEDSSVGSRPHRKRQLNTCGQTDTVGARATDVTVKRPREWIGLTCATLGIGGGPRPSTGAR